MKPERYRQIEELYHAALGRGPEERAAFLEQACRGDEALRREVESLLAYDERAAQFIEGPPDDVAAAMLADDHGQSMVGRTLGHYRVVSLLGSGGMGEVYLAEDTRLKRRVALKLLPREFTADRDRLLRFEQEARAASALNHPNIITIHDIGEVDGSHFIATEFVEGETLRQVMVRGRMSIRESLDIAVQAASALSAAHQAGIVHRDIKPENIMLRPDGYVKVLDFGLAKLTNTVAPQTVDTSVPTEPLAHTPAGTIIGTAQYMSPEQARGLAVDARTDIWSLGCVMYELLAGRAPFAGETVADMLVAIVQKDPPPLKGLTAEAIPDEIDWIIAKTLQKKCEQRYQTSKDLLIDLRRLKERLDSEARPPRKRSSRKAIDSIAVLPFTNASADPHIDYL